MGNIQARLRRGGLPTVDPDDRGDDHQRPCFMVDNVACYTRNQLVLELSKKNRRRMEAEMNIVDTETDADRPSTSDEQDQASADLINKIESSRADCKRMREIAKLLEGMKVELINMEVKQRYMGKPEECRT